MIKRFDIKKVGMILLISFLFSSFTIIMIEINSKVKLEEKNNSNINKYIVSFNTNKGSKIEDILVEENTTCTIPSYPTKGGYEFIEWQLNGKKYDFSSKVTKNITLDAIWKKLENVNIYTVKFDSKGGTDIVDITINENDKVNPPATPKKEGYTFVEWQLNGKKYNFNSKVIKDIKLIAIWEKEIKYKVTFDTDGGNAINNITVLENKKVTIPTPPTKEGYTFVKWELNDKEYDFNTPLTKDITLKAIWEKDIISNTYTVSFDTSGGTSILDIKVEENKKVTIPTPPTKEGYTFVKWELNDKEYDFNTPLTKDITLKAIWEKDIISNTYTVSFDTNGGTSISDIIVNKNDIVKIPEPPTKEGHKFIEWQLNDKPYNFNTEVIDNMILIAIWEKL